MRPKLMTAMTHFWAIYTLHVSSQPSSRMRKGPNEERRKAGDNRLLLVSWFPAFLIFSWESVVGAIGIQDDASTPLWQELTPNYRRWGNDALSSKE